MMSSRFRKAITWCIAAILSLILLFLLADLVFPLRVEVSYAPVVLDRDGKILHAYITADQQWRMKARPDEIMPRLQEAILFKEDRYFHYHPGINLLAVARAAVNNIFSRRRTSGASTITMQVARMLDRKPRTWLNKCIEAFRALQLEKKYTKAEILQLYLNLAPYGSNIQGVKAASILYFNKMPDQLSLAELTALSVIPNRPNSLVIGKDNARIVAYRNKWLRRFREAALFPDAAIEDALQEPLTAFRRPAPSAAPQFCLRMRRRYPGATEIHTTLDGGMQMKAEDIVSGYCAELKLQGIHNAAVLIADNRTHEVLVYIGSSDFNDRLHHGQVDGISGSRSPGSALKPLLYGLAFDRGQLTPKAVMADVPINIGGYSPENYDLGYRGSITAGDALRLSLNIPAVKILDRMGVKSFTEALTRAGFASFGRSGKQAGLSMILGGCEVRLDEMTSLYAAFANQGVYQPLRWLIPGSIWMHKKSRAETVAADTILSPAAAYMLTQILQELHRPDLPNFYDHAKGIPKIAWKTGTSYGRRDAWSIGYNPRYTIGVWAGNFNGQGAVKLNGAGTATPLLFQLFHTIDRNAINEWTPAPRGLSYRLVCALTGKLPTDQCTEQVTDEYIPGISSNNTCDHFREAWISADGRYSYCTSCLPAGGYRTVRYPNFAPDLAGWLDATHYAYEKIPPHNPSCTRIFDGKAPVITSLQNGLTYLVPDNGQMLQLACNASNDVHEVYWYVNDRFAGSCKANGQISFRPADPDTKISCTDDKGRTSNIRIRISLPTVFF